MTDRIAELRELIAEEERAYAAYRQDRSNRENYEHYRGAAKILGDALDRDTPALLDCAEALRPLLMEAMNSVCQHEETHRPPPTVSESQMQGP